MEQELTSIGHDHYVYGSPEEIAAYQEIRDRGVPLKTLSIMGVNTDTREEETSTASGEVILDRPIHDTGSAWYAILSFFLPIIGLIAAYLFLRHNHIRNFKACRKGVLAFLACLGALLGLLGLLILVAVV